MKIKFLFILKKYKIDFICLAGFMKIISKKLLILLIKKLLIFIPLYFQNLKV